MAINRASASVHVSETYGVKERNVSKYNSTLIISFCLVCTVIFCGMLVFPRSTYTTVCVWDLFLFLDGAYRIAAKQIPHVDFHTPLGALNYVLPYWGQKLSGNFGSAMPVALALSLIALMLAMIHILVSRLHYYVALPVALYLQLLVAAPALIQADHTYITMAMWYNRFCWAALSLLLLMYMQPHISSNKIKWFDGLSVGLILLLLVYTKISYGVVGIAFVLLWGLLKRESFLSVTIGFMVFIMIGVLVEIIWHFHQGYIDDIALAMNASGALRDSWETFPKLVLQNLSEILLVSFAWIFVARSRLANVRDFIFVLFVVGSSFAILNQNHQRQHLPCLVAVLSMAVERTTRAVIADDKEASWPKLYAAMALLLVFIAQPIVNYSTVLAKHFAHNMQGPAQDNFRKTLAKMTVADLGVSTSTRRDQLNARLIEQGDFDSLRLYVSPREPLFQVEYFYTISKGIELLKEIDYMDKSLIVFDLTNPFSFMLGLPPARGGFSWFHLHRTFSRKSYIHPDELFAKADVIMVPKFAAVPTTRDALLEIYGDYMRSHYKVAYENQYWTIWSREVALH